VPQHLTSTGEAQVKVWVDEHGRVTKAEVEDADDKDLANAALEEAKDNLYVPYRVDGNNVRFETAHNIRVAVGMGHLPIGAPHLPIGR
jgi:outer membrane biosynthesis protein TonB